MAKGVFKDFGNNPPGETQLYWDRDNSPLAASDGFAPERGGKDLEREYP